MKIEDIKWKFASSLFGLHYYFQYTDVICFYYSHWGANDVGYFIDWNRKKSKCLTKLEFEEKISMFNVLSNP